MRILGADNFTGTTTSIDAIPKSYLRHGDICLVKALNKIFWYRYESNSGLPQEIPNVIVPVDNQDPTMDDGARWLLLDMFISVAYINTIRTDTIIPSPSGDCIKINNVLNVCPSGTTLDTPLTLNVDNTIPNTEPPFFINSDTLVDNLNADFLDGYDADHFVTKEYGITSLPYPHPSGSASPSAGPRWIYLSFSKPASNTDYSVFTTITNTVDTSASVYATTITEKTTSGFICEFSGEIDSPNYKLEYMAIGDFE